MLRPVSKVHARELQAPQQRQRRQRHQQYSFGGAVVAQCSLAHPPQAVASLLDWILLQGKVWDTASQTCVVGQCEAAPTL